MNYADIKRVDVANGTGVRVSLFVSGCTHHCEGCFNSEAWDFNYGQKYDDAAQRQIMNYLKPDYITGLSLLGGEPFEPQNQPELLDLLRRVKTDMPEKTVWCYTGYTFEDDILSGRLGNEDITKEMLSYIDILVDGEFKQELHDLHLRFRGSSNQRIIDVQRSLEQGKTVLWDGDMYI